MLCRGDCTPDRDEIKAAALHRSYRFERFVGQELYKHMIRMEKESYQGMTDKLVCPLSRYVFGLSVEGGESEKSEEEA